MGVDLDTENMSIKTLKFNLWHQSVSVRSGYCDIVVVTSWCDHGASVARKVGDVGTWLDGYYVMWDVCWLASVNI